VAALPLTQPSLVVRIRDAKDTEAWQQFVGIYAPVVYGYLRKRGVQDADAAELTQEVLQGVAAGVGRLNYDPRRGSFSGWLFTLAHLRLHDLLNRQRRQGRGSGDTDAQEWLEAQAVRDDDTTLWAGEYEQGLFAWAAEQVRGDVHESTWQAFWQTAVEGKSDKVVAQRLGMSVAAVYLAKSRVMARLRGQIRQVEGDGSPDSGVES
jgi:RNA polymerase sigma-70 factor (ECF subfamily)